VSALASAVVEYVAAENGQQQFNSREMIQIRE
jgi:hypothetical protein